MADSGGISGLLNLSQQNSASMTDITNQIQNLDPNSSTYQADLQGLSTKMSQMTQQTEMISNILKQLQDSAKSIIDNMR